MMKNLLCTVDNCNDITNSLYTFLLSKRYYLVVVQYVSKLNADDLKKGIRDLRTHSNLPLLSNKMLNFQFASSEV